MMKGEFFETADEERAERVTRLAAAWIKNNPAAWRYAHGRALRELDAGRHASGSQMIEDIRGKDFVGTDGKMPSRPNNNYAPVFSRILRAERPGRADLVKLRTHAYDRISFLALIANLD